MAEVSLPHPKLNAAQQQAVNYNHGHLLIVAGPGTGKTHTLTHRIARVASSIKPTQRILAITFTNKAAEEMKTRLSPLGVSPQQVWAGTFHAFCLQLLRQYWEQTALPKNFKIAAPEDIVGFDKKTLEQISLMKSTRLALEPNEHHKAYTRYLRGKGLIDFDDILREALELLEQEDVAAAVREIHPHIFVDEYQDINIVQNGLLKSLLGVSGTVTAIGDPDQSIYGFRGSEVNIFKRFGADFPSAATMHLKENYRSSPNLLAASHQVIVQQKGDALQLIANMFSEGKLVLFAAATDRAEADYIASQVEKMVGGMDMRSARDAQRSFGDIAILYRLNAQRHVIAQALEHLGIPHQVSAKPSKPQEYSDESALGQYEEILDYSIEKVSLLTLHAAKGLEFPVVFVAGCEDHLLPLDLAEMKGVPEEERRLFYVGMTRAKQCLYLTYASRRQLFGKTMFHEPSPYLSDIKEELKAYEAARQRKKIKKPETVDHGQMKLF